MGQIYKGKIASIDGNLARVVPLDESEKPTTKIMIPWHLRGDTGVLKKGTEVVYVEFADTSGLLLGRVDGNWGEYLPYLESELVETPRGDVKAQGVSLAAHTHTAPHGETSGPHGGGSSSGGNGGDSSGDSSGGDSGGDSGGGGGSGGGGYLIGSGLTLDTATNTLSVDTTDAATETDTRPITSQGVYNEFAVINALLKTI